MKYLYENLIPYGFYFHVLNHIIYFLCALGIECANSINYVASILPHKFSYIFFFRVHNQITINCVQKTIY